MAVWLLRLQKQELPLKAINANLFTVEAVGNDTTVRCLRGHDGRIAALSLTSTEGAYSACASAARKRAFALCPHPLSPLLVANWPNLHRAAKGLSINNCLNYLVPGQDAVVPVAMKLMTVANLTSV